MKRFAAVLLSLGLVGLMAGAAWSAAVTLPDTSSSTILTASVSEQCDIVVPAGVTFVVTDTSVATAASDASVTIGDIVLATATKQLKLSIQASAASFTPPSGALTWAASDVSWDAATWSNGTGASGTLSSAAYTEVATADADATDMASTDLTFTLAAEDTVTRSGDHTLVVTWKVEAIGA